jgi:hypothetical protein
MFTHVRQCVAICILFLATTPSTLAATDLKPEQVLQRHLQSIGTPEARAAVKSRVMEATAAYRILVGGSGEIVGKSVMASEDHKFQLLLKINALQYHGEKFIRDGDKTFVAGTYDDGTRSEFGQFLRSEDFALREGLLGGVLSTGWPLLDLGSRKAKLHYDGLKKVEGSELHAVSYQPKGGSDLDITLYFEPETFRHVMTVYKASVHAGIGTPNSEAGMSAPDIGAGPEVASARQQQTRYRIEERFSEFKTVDGLVLPSHYDLRFQEELQNGFTKLVEWDVTTTRVLSNVTLDPRNFQTH